MSAKKRAPALLNAEISEALTKGGPVPKATQADWKRYIADIKKRFYRATTQAEKDLINVEYASAQTAMREAKSADPNRATSLNVSALTELVVKADGHRSFPNQIYAIDKPHIRRCIEAGLVEPEGRQLVLTDAGVERVADDLIQDIEREQRKTPRMNDFIPDADVRAKDYEKQVREHAAKVAKLESALATLIEK